MSRITISRDSKLISLIDDAIKSDRATDLDKSRLELAKISIQDSETIYEEEILLAVNVITGGKSVTKEDLAGQNTRENGSTNKNTAVKVTRKPELEVEPMHGERRNFSGIMKRFVAGGTKDDGTNYKGYWTKIR